MLKKRKISRTQNPSKKPVSKNPPRAFTTYSPRGRNCWHFLAVSPCVPPSPSPLIPHKPRKKKCQNSQQQPATAEAYRFFSEILTPIPIAPRGGFGHRAGQTFLPAEERGSKRPAGGNAGDVQEDYPALYAMSPKNHPAGATAAFSRQPALEGHCCCRDKCPSKEAVRQQCPLQAGCLEKAAVTHARLRLRRHVEQRASFSCRPPAFSSRREKAVQLVGHFLRAALLGAAAVALLLLAGSQLSLSLARRRKLTPACPRRALIWQSTSRHPPAGKTHRPQPTHTPHTRTRLARRRSVRLFSSSITRPCSAGRQRNPWSCPAARERERKREKSERRVTGRNKNNM